MSDCKFGIRRFAALGLLGTLLALAPLPASACPMCKFANEEKQEDEVANLRPQAYMYSILFMLSMPASLLTAFGYGFYRLAKKQQFLMGDQMLYSETIEPEQSPSDSEQA